MKVGANQVTFLPWVGYFHRLLAADAYVDMLDTQYEKGDYYNRVKIAGQWATVPVTFKHGDRMKDVKISDLRALTKLAKRIEQTYAKETYASRLGKITDILKRWDDPCLLALNIELRDVMANIMGISVIHCRPAVEVGGQETEARLWGMLQATVPQMSQYLSGASGREYLLSAPPVTTLYQKIAKAYDGNSALQLIATEFDPLNAVAMAGSWEA